MNFLVACDTKSYQILGAVVSQLATPPNMVNLEIVHPSARLTTPTVSLQNFTAKLAIGFRPKPHPRPLGAHASQTATWTVSNNCFLCGTERPRIIRVSAASRVPSSPVIQLTPARKSAQIISRQ